MIPWLLVVFTRQLEILETAQALVVQKVDGPIDRINLHPVDSKTLLVSLMFIHWIVIYPMDNAIHLFEQLVPGQQWHYDLHNFCAYSTLGTLLH